MKPVRRRTPLGAAALALVLGAALTACGANPPGAVDTVQSGARGVRVDLDQPLDPALHARLPAKNRASGTLVSVNNGSFPPYEIVNDDGKGLTGATEDLGTALGHVLGVRIKDVSADGLPTQLTGIKAGRFDFALGPIGDFKDRQGSDDFVDWVQEFVVFAVPKGNPHHLTSLASTCGTRIAVMSGGSAEKVIKGQAAKCAARHAKPVQVQSYKDQPSSILAVRSGRADAFFSSQSPLTYFVAQAKDQLQLAGVGEANGFTTLYQGAVVGKGSPLGGVLRDAVQKLMDNGTYEKIMEKWGLKGNEIKKAGINLAVS
ncbi:ABC transporter substrate-binding protein [Streptomyces sp. 8L]|uniref:ABC transporter substrate-binding protein n=1 Tax=unclassified Streptomyces TaxID=2593676 RepID=UPI001CD4597A|nr:ABC transporter substrate-binding protein [Streptomyces sp. 8L]MCA1223198.1 ABC transporter substrate-binding protein [Streptomyces sp. 8L]